MRRYFILLSTLFYVQLSSAQVRNIIDFNNNWKFHLGDDSTAFTTNHKDASWRKLTLPHDWSIEGDFSNSNPATTQGGALPTGIGWYRKTFVLPAVVKNKNIRIEFDGVYRNSEVWINGHYLGKRPYGYSSFSYDLTKFLKAAPANNIIAVKVDNSAQPNSRWYTGSGIYRNVRLVATNKIFIDKYGVFITTPEVNKQSATLEISTSISTNYKVDQNVNVVQTVYDSKGVEVTKKVHSNLRMYFEGTTIAQKLTIDKPKLWSIDKPILYQLKTQIFNGGKLVDESVNSFGIRSFYFDKDKGFFLNNQSLKIKGVCMHHDLGALGAAVNTRAIERQLEILKAMGCNAIRTAHNPPAPELLELCDKMGFLVMVEAFDMWKKKKNKFDYYADFEQWHEKDLLDMVLRDRNHPSVFMWSIGNEIREQFDSSGITIAQELVKIIKQADRSRPVTCALSEWNPEKNFIYKSGALDIVGLNYHHDVYEDFHKYYPGQIFLGAENMSAFATRGHYDMPSDSSYFWPAKSPQKIVENGNADFTVSAYDQVSAYWGSTHETTWKIIKKHDFLSGLFVWSGFDFIGEPIPYPWPARSSYYGIIDLAGFPKDVYYMYQSEWTNKPVLHIFPHWNWTPGKLVDVWAYYNNADEVELFLNGKSLGVRKKTNDDLHVMWRIPFKAGTLTAISRKNEKIVLTKSIKTAGSPYKIKLTADRNMIHANGKDLSFITARVLDKDGNIVPDANNILKFSTTGPIHIAGTDNGYQADTLSLKSPLRKAWKGLALAIIQSSLKKGHSTLTVTSPGLLSGTIALKTTD
ncbi:MAG: sugar-binding domain-containing protein [Ferruginibacter sp.]